MSDDDLEAEIDAVGRAEVFARARALGWTTDAPPEKWVWRAICHDVRSGVPAYASEPKRLDEAILGFRLF